METRMFFLLTVAFVLALAAAGQAYQVNIIDENSPYNQYYTAGTAYALSAAYHEDGPAKGATASMWLTGDEWGQAYAWAGGTTTAYVVNYDPNIDPPIALYYKYYVDAKASIDVFIPPVLGTAESLSYATLDAGGETYGVSASATYAGQDDQDHEWDMAEDSVNLSWQGAEFAIGFTAFACAEGEVEGATSTLSAGGVSGIYKQSYVIYEP